VLLKDLNQSRIATIGAKPEDFIEVDLDVVGFNFKIAGQPTVVAYKEID
jgi:hypothetical protein